MYVDPAGTLPRKNDQFYYDYFDCGLGYNGGSGGGVIILPDIWTIVEDFAEDVSAAVVAVVAAMSKLTEYESYSVYYLTDPSDQLIKYVGITNDPARRLREHQHDPLHPKRQNYTMTVIMSGLTKDYARFIEQILISAFTLSYLENARREISVRNIEKYNCYLNAAVEVFSASEFDLWDLIGGS